MMKTVVMRLNGGMGNQMFQYAFAKALAERYDATLELDTSVFDLPYVREAYRLDEFGIRPRFSSTWRNQFHRLLLSPRFPRPLRRLIVRLAGIKIVDRVKSVDGSQRTTLLVGYFQHPVFFANAIHALRKDFELPIAGAPAEACLDRIISEVSVAVHVRRGDYVEVPLFRDTLGVLSAEYYRKAIAEMRHRVPGARFFFFTNDPDWVERALLATMTDGELVRIGSGCNDTTELALMRACTHFIVGNSTFSWWPAYLSEAHEKTVIAPSPWFRCGDVADEDLVLPSWITCGSIWEAGSDC